VTSEALGLTLADWKYLNLILTLRANIASSDLLSCCFGLGLQLHVDFGSSLITV
jgi:hypothetical protein